MAEKQQWEAQLVTFLKRAQEELKRSGEELRTEAQRVLEQVRDPQSQQRVKENLLEFGAWARRTAGEAAGMIDHAVQKLETSLRAAAVNRGAREPPSETPRPSDDSNAETVKERTVSPRAAPKRKDVKGSKMAAQPEGKRAAPKRTQRKKA